MIESTGRYRIQVVAELTGIPAPTLRAWERRYGIPSPARTASAYRLYSDRDVALVRRLRDLCASGISIAEAAKLARSSEEGAAVIPSSDGDACAVAVQRILDAIVAFDARGVEREAARAQYLGPATLVFDRVFAPVMRRVGDLWHEGSLSVAQEHIATTVVGDVVRALVRLTNPEDADRVVLLACFAEEEHLLPVQGVALRLASWGIGNVTLGARTPPMAIAEAARRMQPDAVGLSLTTAIEPGRGGHLIDAYAEACGAIPWFVGGAGASSVAQRVEARGGTVIEGSVVAARAKIERLLRPIVAGDPAAITGLPVDDG